MMEFQTTLHKQLRVIIITLEILILRMRVIIKIIIVIIKLLIRRGWGRDVARKWRDTTALSMGSVFDFYKTRQVKNGRE